MFGRRKKNEKPNSAESSPIYPMIINGEKVTTGSIHTVINPFDLSSVGRYHQADIAVLNEAVSAAKQAFQSWSQTSDQIRAEACQNIAKVFEDNAKELSALITQEQGKPLDAGGFGSGFEIGGCIGWSQATGALSLTDKTVFEDDAVRAVQKRVPLGVVGSITPWNWPVLIAIWHVVPAIRTGNTVVIKPSPLTPLSTLRAVELINDVLPAGVLNVVTGDAEIGGALSSHPDIAKIVFTGSTATGKKVLANTAETLSHCTLELGGNDAAIVLPGAPVEHMAPGLFFGSFINAGQTCGCIKRLYVHEADYEKACNALAAIAGDTSVGNGLLAESDMGPIQNKAQHAKVRRLIDEAVTAGADLMQGGEQVGEGYAITPAILSNAKHGMAIVDEEQFGPALPIIKYSTLDEAITMANSSEFGLCASVWGTDPDQLASVSNQLSAGTVYINTHAELNPMIPFGGIKASGIGVQFGEEGLLAFTNSKIVYERKPA